MVKLTKIYTRTGDDGTTGLVDGSRAAKTDARMAAIGDVDEANSVVGHAIAAIVAADPAMAARLAVIQHDLFDLGADLATPAEPGDDPFAPDPMRLRIISPQIDRLEREIDALTATMPPLTSFILPGGNEAAARLQVARAVVRRAERSAVAAAGAHAINPLAITYLNRLSDHLFVHARALARADGGEVLWVPGASR